MAWASAGRPSLPKLHPNKLSVLKTQCLFLKYGQRPFLRTLVGRFAFLRNPSLLEISNSTTVSLCRRALKSLRNDFAPALTCESFKTTSSEAGSCSGRRGDFYWEPGFSICEWTWPALSYCSSPSDKREDRRIYFDFPSAGSGCRSGDSYASCSLLELDTSPPRCAVFVGTDAFISGACSFVDSSPLKWDSCWWHYLATCSARLNSEVISHEGVEEELDSSLLLSVFSSADPLIHLAIITTPLSPISLLLKSMDATFTFASFRLLANTSNIFVSCRVPIYLFCKQSFRVSDSTPVPSLL